MRLIGRIKLNLLLGQNRFQMLYFMLQLRATLLHPLRDARSDPLLLLADRHVDLRA